MTGHIGRCHVPLHATTQKADCIRAIGFPPQPVLLGCSKLAIIERGIMATACKQLRMGSTFDDITVFHV